MCKNYTEHNVCIAICDDGMIGEHICSDCDCREEIEEYQAFAKLVFRDRRISDGNIKKLRVTGDHELLEEVLENWFGE